MDRDKVKCKICNGSGIDDEFICDFCGGFGEVLWITNLIQNRKRKFIRDYVFYDDVVKFLNKYGYLKLLKKPSIFNKFSNSIQNRYKIFGCTLINEATDGWSSRGKISIRIMCRPDSRRLVCLTNNGKSFNHSPSSR